MWLSDGVLALYAADSGFNLQQRKMCKGSFECVAQNNYL